MYRILLACLLCLSTPWSANAGDICKSLFELSHEVVRPYCEQWAKLSTIDPVSSDACRTKGVAWPIAYEGTQWSLFKDKGAIATVSGTLKQIRKECKGIGFHTALFYSLIESQRHNVNAQCALYECRERWRDAPFGYLVSLRKKGKISDYVKIWIDTKPEYDTSDDQPVVVQQNSSDDNTQQEILRKGKQSGISGLK